MTAPIGLPDKFGALLDTARSPQPGIAAPKQPAGASFAEQVQKFVSEIDATQKDAQVKSDDFATGKSNDIHGTMIAVEEADISLRMLANVRNRVVEMYREVMRMGS
jgi:flagellar hook-basal body complex protein FliE